MNLLTELPALGTWQLALLAAPLLCFMGAAALASVRGAVAAAWSAAQWAAITAAAASAASVVAMAFAGAGASFGLRADWPGVIVLLLVSFIGWVIIRYSQPYLAGEPNEARYIRDLMLTLAAVTAVVMTNNVLVLALAWMATSVALHRLLTFFSQRRAAVVAAHKKFIAGRLADMCMLGAAALLYITFDTLQLDAMIAQAQAMPQLPAMAQAAVVLAAVAALLKCAQLPFHGWLIQVMEAPTPVSALLHAGVVNLGGFVLIRMAPLVNEVIVAQALLVVLGTTTAVLAALVMTTRISIKVALAWSTCAQMGFMLLQCGLGMWEMALLHLVAHSLYKAHAFLSAGGTVRQAQIAQLAAPTAGRGLAAALFAAMIGIAVTVAAGWIWSASFSEQPALWLLAAIVALALTPVVDARGWASSFSCAARALTTAVAIALLYFALHAVLVTWLAPPQASVPTWLLVIVAFSFAALFIVQSLVSANPQHAAVRALYPWFYGGFFLDERISRALFRLLPPPAIKR
jgi:NAD(P)H-quinone oxidoreductase subunit 5